MSTVTGTAADPYAALNASSSSVGKKKEDSTTASADRFLTMLVTQMQNQDPLNPMDNAQITSQMAQINTVTALEKVNESVGGLGTRMLQMQMLQGASLVGRDVLIEGDKLTVRDGLGLGALELAGKATSVKVEVRDVTGKNVVDTIQLGTLEAGRHGFEWDPGTLPQDVAYTFNVVATSGSSAVQSWPLTVDRVRSVSVVGDKLALSLANNGFIAAESLVAVN